MKMLWTTDNAILELDVTENFISPKTGVSLMKLTIRHHFNTHLKNLHYMTVLLMKLNVSNLGVILKISLT